jgi:uncharacterized membrane protein
LFYAEKLTIIQSINTGGLDNENSVWHLGAGIKRSDFPAILYCEPGRKYLTEEATQQGGSVGIFVALLFLVGGAFAFGVPKVSFVIMLLAGFFGIAAGSYSLQRHDDMGSHSLCLSNNESDR